MILVDAGPLVALIHRDDRHHAACKEALRSLREPLVTVWPAFTEAVYLLGFSWAAQDALWEFVERGALSIARISPSTGSRTAAPSPSFRRRASGLAPASAH